MGVMGRYRIQLRDSGQLRTVAPVVVAWGVRLFVESYGVSSRFTGRVPGACVSPTYAHVVGIAEDGRKAYLGCGLRRRHRQWS